jgi:hypothetical protein
MMKNEIKPLGQGSFDADKFLRALKELGSRGPIGLQCYGMEAWKKINK